MKYKVYEAKKDGEEYLKGEFCNFKNAKEMCKDLWDILEKPERYETVIQIIEYDKNKSIGMLKYELSTDYKELEDDALVYVDDSLDEYDLDALREIARRCDKLEEFEASEDWEDLIEDCKEYLWMEVLKNEGR